MNNGNVLQPDRAVGYTTVYSCRDSSNVHLKLTNFIPCQLHFERSDEESKTKHVFLMMATFPLKLSCGVIVPYTFSSLSSVSSFLRTSAGPVVSSLFPSPSRGPREQGLEHLPIPALKRNHSVCIKVTKGKTQMQWFLTKAL